MRLLLVVPLLSVELTGSQEVYSAKAITSIKIIQHGHVITQVQHQAHVLALKRLNCRQLALVVKHVLAEVVQIAVPQIISKDVWALVCIGTILVVM